jgi:RNA polymerase sigma-70 factor (ECF subfamily)
MVFAMLKNKQDTEEVIQDASLKVIDSLLCDANEKGAFKYQSSLKTWIYTIALNKAKDKIAYNTRDKRKAIFHSLSLDADEPSSAGLASTTNPPDLEMEHNEGLLRLWKSINMLPVKQREALILTKIDHNSMKETAMIMDTTPKAVESLLSRGRANLKNIIEQNIIENE